MGGIEEVREFGRTLVVIGLVIVLAGGVMLVWGKVPFVGKLPGDIVIRGEHFTLYFPIVSMLIIGAVISAILFLMRK